MVLGCTACCATGFFHNILQDTTESHVHPSIRSWFDEINLRAATTILKQPQQQQSGLDQQIPIERRISERQRKQQRETQFLSPPRKFAAVDSSFNPEDILLDEAELEEQLQHEQNQHHPNIQQQSDHMVRSRAGGQQPQQQQQHQQQQQLVTNNHDDQYVSTLHEQMATIQSHNRVLQEQVRSLQGVQETNRILQEENQSLKDQIALLSEQVEKIVEKTVADKISPILQQIQHLQQQFQSTNQNQIQQQQQQRPVLAWEQSAAEQQQPASSISPQRKDDQPVDDRSAFQHQSYRDIVQKKGVFKLPTVLKSKTQHKMAAVNDVFTKPDLSLEEVCQRIRPSSKTNQQQNIPELASIFIKVRLSPEAKLVEYQTMRKIFDKAGAPQPYNIRRMFGGFYHLAVNIEDTPTFVEKMDQPSLRGIVELFEGAAAPDIFSAPPLKEQTPEQIRNVVAESMGFALGRSYHPATDQLYHQICTEAGHADLMERIRAKAKAIRNKAMDMAILSKRGNNTKKTKKSAVTKTDSNSTPATNQNGKSVQSKINNNTSTPDETTHNTNNDNNDDVQMLNHE